MNTCKWIPLPPLDKEWKVTKLYIHISNYHLNKLTCKGYKNNWI